MKINFPKLNKYLAYNGTDTFSKVKPHVFNRDGKFSLDLNLLRSPQSDVISIEKTKLNGIAKEIMVGLFEQQRKLKIKPHDINALFELCKSKPELERGKIISLSKLVSGYQKGFNIKTVEYISNKINIKNVKQLMFLEKLCTAKVSKRILDEVKQHEIIEIMQKIKKPKKSEITSISTDFAQKFELEQLDDIFMDYIDYTAFPNRKNIYADNGIKHIASVIDDKKIKGANMKMLLSDLSYMIDGGIKDHVIRKKTQKYLNEVNKFFMEFGSLEPEWIKDITELFDLAHSLENRSYSLKSPTYETIKMHLNAEDTEKTYRAHLKKIGKAYEVASPQFYDSYKFKSSTLLKNSLETDALRNIVKKYSAREPKFTKYLYEKYYLPTLSSDAKAGCKKLMDDFGVKLFLEDSEDSISSKMIHNELSEWQRVFGKKFNTPDVVDTSRFDPYYSKNHAAGYANLHGKICLSADSPIMVAKAFRHELIHLNDEKFFFEDRIVDGIDFGQIQAEYLYENEFKNAGIEDRYINYAYTNKKEFIAVASQGDYSKYSKGFKKILVKLGFPKKVFEMKNEAEVNALKTKRVPRQDEKFKEIPVLDYNLRACVEDLFVKSKKTSNSFNKDFSQLFGDIDEIQVEPKVTPVSKMLKTAYNNYLKTASTCMKLEKEMQTVSKENASLLEQKYYNARMAYMAMIYNPSAIKNSIDNALVESIKITNPNTEKLDKVAQKVIEGLDKGLYKIVSISNPKADGSNVSFNKAQLGKISEMNEQKGLKTLLLRTDSDCKMTVLNRDGILSELQFVS